MKKIDSFLFEQCEKDGATALCNRFPSDIQIRRGLTLQTRGISARLDPEKKKNNEQRLAARMKAQEFARAQVR